MSLQGRIQDLPDECTFHGLNHINQRQSVIWKVFWLILTFGGFALACYGVIGIIVRWSDNPTASEVSLITRGSLKLPHLSIVTRNLLNADKLALYNISDNLLKVFDAYAINFPIAALFGLEQSQINVKISPKQWLQAREEFNLLMKKTNSTSFDQFLDKFGLKCQDIVKHCTLNGAVFQCCTGIPNHLFYIGTGFILNTGNQNTEGSGLDIRVSNRHLIQRRDYYAPFKSIQVGIIPDLEKEKGFNFMQNLPLSKASVLTLSKTVIDAVNNPPTFRCNSDPKYMRVNCQSECMSIIGYGYNQSYCNCSNPMAEKTHSVYCDPWQWQKCSSQAEQKLTEEKMERASQCFTTNCLKECTQTKFDMNLAVAEFNVETLASGWGISIEEAETELQDLTLIRLLYTKMEEQYIRQYFSMSLSSALSEIGGQIGLFLGASLLTFIHLFVFCIEKCCFRKHEKKSSEVHPSLVALSRK